MAALAKCAVCIDDFEKEGDKIPKLLPCSHTVCLLCLCQFRRGGLRCPECRAPHQVPNGGPRAFPTNRYVVEILDLIHQNTASNPRQDNLSEAGVPQCEEHQKPCVMVCLKPECWKLLCPRCPVQEHHGHKLAGFGESVEDLSSLSGSSYELLEEIKRLSSYERNVERNKDLLCLKRDEAVREVDLHVELLKRSLDEKASMLKRGIKIKATEEAGQLDRVVQQIKAQANLGNQIKEVTEDLATDKEKITVKDLIKIKKHIDNFTRSPRQKIHEEVKYDLISFNGADPQTINVGKISTERTVVNSSHLDLAEIHVPLINTETLEPLRIDFPTWLLPPDISSNAPRVPLPLDLSDDEIPTMDYDFWRNQLESGREPELDLS